MLKRIRIDNANDPLFQASWELYNDAFPYKEVRSLNYHTETLECEEFHADVIIDDQSKQFIGLIFWWDLAGVRYIEHFATHPSLRGQGHGKLILEEFIAESDKRVLLEVEHPEDEMQRRRIGFYERLGFVLNSHDYAHPPYRPEMTEFLSLAIMTSGTSITEQDLAQFVNKEHKKIHFRYKF